MNDSGQLREQMWDLIYGLLEPAESQALVTRIKSDPQAARLYAEVRLQADLVGYASKVEDSSLVLSPDRAAKDVAPAKTGVKRSASTSQPASASKERGSRGGGWLTGIAATALAILILLGLYWPKISEQDLAPRFVVVNIGVPPPRPAGISNKVPIHVTDLQGIGKQAEGTVVILDREGREHFRNEFSTSAIGHAEVEVPGQALQPGAQIEVSAAPVADEEASSDAVADTRADRYEEVAERIERRKSSFDSKLVAELPVQEEPLVQYFFTEKPVVAAGETTQFGFWSFKAFTGTPAPTEIASAAVEKGDGTRVAEPVWSVEKGVEGVVVGKFAVPPASDGAAPLLAFHDQYGFAYRAQITAAVMQQDEQAAGKENTLGALALANGQQTDRVRRAIDPARAMLAPSPAAKLEEADKSVKEGKQTESHEKKLAQQGVEIDGRGAIKAGESLAAEDKELEIQVPADAAKKSLFAVVTSGGKPVAAAPIEALEDLSKDLDDRPEADSLATWKRSAKLRVPPEVQGPLTVRLYDDSIQPPQLLEEQVVLRQSPRKLNIELLDGKESYQPGEEVRLTFAISDENGQPAADAHVAVRVWNEEQVQGLGDQPLLLADAVQSGWGLQTGAVESPLLLAQKEANRPLARFHAERPEEARKYERSEEFARELAMRESLQEQEKLVAPKSPGEPELKGGAGAAPSGAGGGYGGPESTLALDALDQKTDYDLTYYFAQPNESTLASNRSKVAAEFEAAKAIAEEDRRAAVGTIGRVLLFGGCGALLLLGILALLRLPARARVVVPSLLVAAASIVLGLGWIGWSPMSHLRQIAMAPPEAATPPAQDAAPTATAPPRSAEDPSALQPSEPADQSEFYSARGAGAPAHDFAEFAGGLPANAPADATPGTPPATPPSVSGKSGPPGLAGEAEIRGQSARSDPGSGSAAAKKDAEVASRGGAASQPAGGAVTQHRFKAQADAVDKIRDSNELKNELRAPAAEAAPADAPAPASPSPARPAAAAPAASAPSASATTAPTPARAIEVPAPAAKGAGVSEGENRGAVKPSKPESSSRPSRNVADDQRLQLERLDGDRFGADELKAKRSAGLDAFAPPLDGLASGAPSSLYFNPILRADANGRATIEFTMPPVESQYRLLIDALGNGRIGSLQAPIVCKSEE